MSDGQSAKFTGTTQGHRHNDQPRIYLGPTPPTEGMKRGDIWVYVDDGTEVVRSGESPNQ